MEEYSKSILRVVVAQICQTIGWHSIQSTPLELLIDILHKYMQEISVRSTRYTNLYGRVEANLDDVGLCFRDLGINIPDLLEYINNVDSVPCAVDVPRYPVRKESSLNFLKPGSKEVITRPVHIHEHLPPIHPEKEDEALPTPTESIPSIPNPIGSSADPDSVITDITNTAANTANIANNKGLFRKPDLSDITSSLKKPRPFHEDEGRPTREISSVMMTSSGFISPAREGKLPESKPPVIPEYKPPRPATPPPAPPLPTATSVISVSPTVANVPEVKPEKKVRRQRNQGGNANTNNAEAKEQRKRDRHLAKVQKRRGGAVSVLDPTARKKQRVKEMKGRNPQPRMHDMLQMKHPIPAPTVPFEELPLDVSLPADLTIKSEAVPMLSCGGLSTDVSTLPKPIPPAVKANMARADEVKLSSEPDKKKYSIFKKISSKNSRDENAKAPSLAAYHPLFDNIPMLPESTTIRPIPQMRSNSPPHTDPNVIVVDDDTPPRSSSPAGVPPSMLPISLPPGITATSTSGMPSQFCDNSFRSVRPSPVKKQQRKPRKTKQQILSEQSAPLNLSNEASCRISNLQGNIDTQPAPPPPQAKTPRRKPNKVGRPKRTNAPPGGGFPSASPFPANVDLPSMVPENLKRDDMSPLNIFKDNQFLPGMPRYPMLGSFHLLGPGLIPNTSFMPRHPLFPFRNPFGYSDWGLRPPYRPPYRPPKIDETPSTPPPVVLPLELENSVFCNVPPLVPESMKFQLPPQLMSQSNKPLGSMLGGNSVSEHISHKTPNSKHDSLNVYHGGGHSTAISKSPKPLDAPIEISDDEKSVTKSDTEAELVHEPPATSNASRGGGHSERNPISENAHVTGKNTASIQQQRLNDAKANDSNDGCDSVIESDAAAQGDKNSNVSDEIATVGGGGGGGGVGLGGKTDKKREKEHKKGKRDKDGKIKKKKDKKDKTKNKEKAEKRKEEKKEKDRSKKKKEKRKEKMKVQPPFSDMMDDAKLPAASSGVDHQALQSDMDASASGMTIVPKLTLKFGSPRSIASDDSPEIRKLSTKSLNGAEDSVDNICLDERRESSPELARISPLVTRPPKQKTTKEKASDNEQATASGNVMSTINPTSSSSSAGSVAARGPGRPPKNQNTGVTSNAQNQLTSASRSSASVQSSANTVEETTVSGTIESKTCANPLLGSEKGSGPGSGASKNSIGKSKSFRASLKTANVSNSAGPSTVQANSDPIDAEGNQVWICPACGRVDDGTPMIGCDGCDAWYHWECVGIQEPPHENEDWYCRVCIAKKQEANGSDRKKKRKKKNKTN